jgi:hypothetical protein
MSINVILCIVFIIEMICFPACINVNIRRAYGRIFGTRIDTKIYTNIFYFCAIFVCVLFVLMQLGI